MADIADSSPRFVLRILSAQRSRQALIRWSELACELKSVCCLCWTRHSFRGPGVRGHPLPAGLCLQPLPLSPCLPASASSPCPSAPACWPLPLAHAPQPCPCTGIVWEVLKNIPPPPHPIDSVLSRTFQISPMIVKGSKASPGPFLQPARRGMMTLLSRMVSGSGEGSGDGSVETQLMSPPCWPVNRGSLSVQSFFFPYLDTLQHLFQS